MKRLCWVGWLLNIPYNREENRCPAKCCDRSPEGLIRPLRDFVMIRCPERYSVIPSVRGAFGRRTHSIPRAFTPRSDRGHGGTVPTLQPSGRACPRQPMAAYNPVESCRPWFLHAFREHTSGRHLFILGCEPAAHGLLGKNTLGRQFSCLAVPQGFVNVHAKTKTNGPEVFVNITCPQPTSWFN